MSFRTVRESIVSDLECRRTTARLTLEFHLSRWIITAQLLNNHCIMARNNRIMRHLSRNQRVRAAKAKFVCVNSWIFLPWLTTRPRHRVATSPLWIHCFIFENQEDSCQWLDTSLTICQASSYVRGSHLIMWCSAQGATPSDNLTSTNVQILVFMKELRKNHYLDGDCSLNKI